MDEQTRQRLSADAEKGNKIAERLLLNTWLAGGDQASVAQLMEQYRARGDRVGGLFLEAELTCFHAWQTDDAWQEMLQQCSAAGHKEARFVESVYAAWADWQRPSWTALIEEDGVRVEVSSEFAPRAIVGFLRAMLGPQLRPSGVIDPESGNTIAHPIRINQSAQWLPEQLGWTGKLLECRLAEACGYPIAHGEVLSLLHYRPGQRYKAHLDCISRKQAESETGKQEGGQRLLTVLLALGDDDYAGGETYFPRLNKGAKSPTGSLLRFNNTDSDDEPLHAALHEGSPIESGEKWLLSKWVRQSPTPYGREIAVVCPREA